VSELSYWASQIRKEKVMNPIKIDASTFRATGRNSMGDELGTVMVNGESRVAARAESGAIYLYGYVGCYRTSSKLWPVTVVLWTDDRVMTLFGRDEHTSRCQQSNAVRYDPDAYQKVASGRLWDAI
jgi:hypothetical protein